MKKAFLCVAAIAAAAASGGVAAQYVNHDTVKCGPFAKEELKPQMELQRKLAGEGWKVRQVKTFNGCYEVYGFDAKGQRVEAFFDPKTFDKIGEVKQAQ